MTLGYVLSFVFTVFDVITGFILAVKNKNVNSTKFRDGMFKKSGNALLMAFGYAVDYAISYVDIGFDVPIGATICVGIIIMESISILENVGEINPDLVKLIKPFMAKLNGGETDGNSEQR